MSVCLNETNVSVELSVVVPFYNESDSLQGFFDVIIPIIRDMNITYELICINDGSKDKTLDLLIQKKQQIKNIKIESIPLISFLQFALRSLIIGLIKIYSSNDVSLEIAKLQWILVDLYAGFLSIK